MASQDERNAHHFENLKQFNIGHLFFFLLLFIVFYFVFRILQPYLNTIILAIILATVFYPLHRIILKKMGGRKNLSAGLTCGILITLVVLPLALVTLAMIQQGIHSFNAIQDWLAEGNLEELLKTPLAEKVFVFAEKHLPNFKFKEFKLNESLIKVSSSIGSFLLDQGGQILGNITSIFIKFFMMIFAFFFVVRDGEVILEGILHIIPLSTSQEDKILEKIRVVARSALLGTLVTAIAQGTAGGIAFAIAGLPGLFWGTVMAFVSLIPVVGTALVWVPASGYLFLSGRWGYALFMALWCTVIIGSLDNFIRPYFMKGAAGMSPILIFFAILGGINYFGLIGILYGPLIFGLAMVLLYIYDLEFGAFLDYQDKH